MNETSSKSIPTSSTLVSLGDDFPYELHERQSDAYDTIANEIFFGGAKGPGKSFWLRYCMIVWCFQAPGLQCVLFRKHFSELMANHMVGPRGFREMLASYIRQKIVSIVGKQVRFWNGSCIKLSHLQLDKDLAKWQGVEMHVLGIDQLEQFSEYAYRWLRANVRIIGWVPPPEMDGFFPKILATGNPGGISHQFVKDTFVGTPEENRANKLRWMTEECPDASQGPGLRLFVPARAEDNPELQNDPTYLQRLEGLGNPELIRALREGDWEVVAGSMFGYVWRDHRHVCDPFDIPASWDIWRGGDDGFAAPSAIYEMTQDPDTGTFYCIDEIYESGLVPDVLAEKILKMDAGITVDLGDGEVILNDAPIRGVYDSSGFSDTGTGRKSRGHQMNELGCRWRAVEKGPHSRVMRCQMMHQVLAPNKKNRICKEDKKPYPGLMFFRHRCPNAVRTLKQLPISKHNPEDVDTASEDHCFVAGTLIATEDRLKPIESIKIGERVWTRLGLYPVVRIGKRSNQAVISRFGITATPKHKFWTNDGWKSFALLTPLDMVCQWPSRLFTSELNTHVTLTRPGERTGFISSRAEVNNGCTASSGVNITAKYPKVVISTIEMETPAIMPSRIWNALLQENIQTGISKHCDQGCARISKKHNRPRENGTVRLLDAHGIASTARKSLKRPSSRDDLLVRNVIADLLQQDRQEQGYAAAHVRPTSDDDLGLMMLSEDVRYAENISRQTDTVEAERARADVADVYNLTIGGPPEFFANGILVMNSFDGITYGLTEKKSWFARARVKGI